MSGSFILTCKSTVDQPFQIGREQNPGLADIELSFASVQHRSDFKAIVRQELKKLINFDHFLCLLGNENQTRSCYYQFASDNSEGHLSEDQFRKIFIENATFNQTITTDFPLNWSLVESLGKPVQVTKVKQIVGFRLLFNGEGLGVFYLASGNSNPFSCSELSMVNQLSPYLSLALKNIFSKENTEKLQKENLKSLDLSLKQREEEFSLLLSLSKDIATVRNTDSLNKVISRTLRNIFQIDNYIVSIKNDQLETHSYLLVEPRSAFFKNLGFDKLAQNESDIKGSIAHQVFGSTGANVFHFKTLLNNKKQIRPDIFFKLVMEDNNGFAIPLRAGDSNIGILWAYTNKSIDERLLKNVTAQIAVALANTVANEKIEKQFAEINNYKLMLETENLYLQEEIQTTSNCSEIVGKALGMREVFLLVSQVSESESSVLILGETGTGKELIARAIHNSSPRRNKLMIKINCATLPSNLIESELFGHERGSFTGATEKRIGKFELANRSTLFLDEIGELSLDLQAKLLRVLQEKEIERVGGRQVIKTDVRIIAATNRDLKKEVAAGNFRSDLYFRLDVFPITIPPLRDRKEDIPVLTEHFLIKHANKRNKGNLTISIRAMKQFMAYDWPGNVRELEHMVERSILLASGSTISIVNLPAVQDEDNNSQFQNSRIQTLDENERDHIIKVLKICNSKIAGIGGAAEILDLPSTTLNSKIRKLNIKKSFLDE